MKLPSWLPPLLVIALIGGVVGYQHLQKQSEVPAQVLSCTALAAGCEAMLGKEPVKVGITGEIKVLQPFEVWLQAATPLEKVQASFTMEGMDMGFNLYTLRPDPQGVYRARITLPVCVSGRRDWRMTLEILGAHEKFRLTVPFVTEM